MFGWSRWESWLAVAVSVLLVTGVLGHWWLDRRWGRGGLGPVIIEPAAAATLASDAGSESAGAAAGDAYGTAAGEADGPCPPAAAPVPAAAVDLRIDINRAQASELERLPGIGPALARRIVEYREAWGPFTVIEDIMEVPGIGPAKFNAIRDLIRVQ
ncbi:MAG TPA: helix-hairpin-helix domain-containing protein [Limnochordales bacterium]|nr:helix-hairpin-helix domain-containing protein [Limnochordales bacterium]